MDLSPSAYTDAFARDHLPPAAQWPTLELTAEELRHADRLNAATELIDIPVDRFGAGRAALRVPDGETWTYGELQRRANQVAQVLTEDLGLVPGNRVLVRSPNNPWTVAAWLGVLKAGGIATMTFAALRARELAPLAEKTKPRIALVDHRFVSDVETLRDTITPSLTIVPYGGGDGDLTARASAKSGVFANVETAADDVALFCPTSGSTGVPKICAHFHRDIVSIDNTFGRAVLRLRPDDMVACTAPFAFTFGLGMLIVFPLRAGACALLTEAATPAQLADIAAGHAVTVLATAPTAFKQILAAGKIGRLRGLRAGVSAGEHIPPQTWQRIHDELGLKVIDGLGTTEMLHIFISAAGDDIRLKSTGKPLPGYRATILDDEGNELPPDQEGRLAVIGPVGCRYLADDRQAGYVVNGWNVTGDTFTRDEDGYFYYRARTDNMIVSSGYNISGAEVEAAIDEHPDVIESAVVAEPDPVRGSIVCAFVVLKDGTVGDAVKAAEIQDFVKQTLAPYKYPRHVRFTGALPRNISGKLQHFRLREQIAAETAAGTTAETSA